MSNRQAIKKAEFQALDAWGRHPRLNIKGAWDRHPRLSIQTLRPKARVSTSRCVGSTPASQHQDALTRRPRLNIKVRWLDARVSASRHVDSTPVSQHQGAWDRHPRLSIKARGIDNRVSTSRRVGSTPTSQHQGALARRPRLSCNYPNYGASHRTHRGRWPLIRERFQGARSPPETPINGPSRHARGRRIEKDQINNRASRISRSSKASTTEREKTLQQAYCVLAALRLPPLLELW